MAQAGEWKAENERLRKDAEKWIDIGFGMSAEGFNGEYTRGGDDDFRLYAGYIAKRTAAIAAQRETHNG